MKRSFPQTDILKQGRAVFDIGGNKWRVVARIDYVSGIVFVRFVGPGRNMTGSMSISFKAPAMDIRVIRTEAEHDGVLAEIDRLLSLGAPSHADRERLELLALLSEAYEDKHHPMPLPDPIEAIRSRMLDLGLSAADLADVLGGSERAADVLGRATPLTLPMVRGLAARLGLPLDVLVQDYEVTSRAA